MYESTLLSARGKKLIVSSYQIISRIRNFLDADYFSTFQGDEIEEVVGLDLALPAAIGRHITMWKHSGAHAHGSPCQMSASGC